MLRVFGLRIRGSVWSVEFGVWSQGIWLRVLSLGFGVARFKL
jgi:hypothetical protein